MNTLVFNAPYNDARAVRSANLMAKLATQVAAGRIRPDDALYYLDSFKSYSLEEREDLRGVTDPEERGGWLLPQRTGAQITITVPAPTAGAGVEDFVRTLADLHTAVAAGRFHCDSAEAIVNNVFAAAERRRETGMGPKEYADWNASWLASLP